MFNRHQGCLVIFNITILILSLVLVLVTPKPQVDWAEVECFCTPQYDPICASDRRRYRNQCTFQCRVTYLEENSLSPITGVRCLDLLPK
ncbi:uncharacterized protein LOC128199976 [Galleria mellonella]|uniref:Uncharacterized protein LOC128199976 n=1 Tax=Galleria mellonella TaxID=7137 RepID=A0ABM3MV61_GALME|nr:uncharacterized protein LOC128199976 [Galleria mellonella]